MFLFRGFACCLCPVISLFELYAYPVAVARVDVLCCGPFVALAGSLRGVRVLLHPPSHMGYVQHVNCLSRSRQGRRRSSPCSGGSDRIGELIPRLTHARNVDTLTPTSHPPPPSSAFRPKRSPSPNIMPSFQNKFCPHIAKDLHVRQQLRLVNVLDRIIPCHDPVLAKAREDVPTHQQFWFRESAAQTGTVMVWEQRGICPPGMCRLLSCHCASISMRISRRLSDFCVRFNRAVPFPFRDNLTPPAQPTSGRRPATQHLLHLLCALPNFLPISLPLLPFSRSRANRRIVSLPATGAPARRCANGRIQQVLIVHTP